MTEYSETDENDEFGTSLNEQIGGGDNNKSFIDYITSFSSSEKAQMMNIVQYCGILVIPLLAVLKMMKIYMPINNHLKPTSELVFEVIVQLIVILVSFFLIHKFVLYFPTYSEVKYENFSLLSGMLPLLFLMFTLDTKISEKLNVLFDRFLGMLGLIKEPLVEEEDSQQNGDGNNGKQQTAQEPMHTMQHTMQPPQMQTTSIEELSGMPSSMSGGLQGNGCEPLPANMF